MKSIKYPNYMPEDLFKKILRMLETFNNDMDLRKPLTDVGWVPLHDHEINKLYNVNFCEIDYTHKKCRINYNAQLPAELLSTDQGLIFRDYVEAIKIVEGMSANYLEAVITGLKQMLINAQYILWEKEEGLIPAEFRKLLNPYGNIIAKKEISKNIVKIIVKAIWDVDIFPSLDSIAENAHNEQHSITHNFQLIIKTIIESPQWHKIIDFFRSHKYLIEALGLIWYASLKIKEKDIEYLGAELFVYENAIKLVAVRNNKDTISLHGELLILNEKIAELLNEELWGVVWENVFRTPY